MEVRYCETDFLVIISVDIWKDAESELTLRDEVDKLSWISAIKWIRLFNFDPEMLMMFHSVSKCGNSSNDVPCENLFINITQVIIDFIIIIIIIIEITTIRITIIWRITISTVSTIPL